jgi:hypothetical protein
MGNVSILAALAASMGFAQLGMRVQEMAQRCKKLLCMPSVAPVERASDVLHDHGAHLIRPMTLLHELAGKARGNDLGHVLVLGERQNLLLGKATKSDAVLQRYHSRTSPFVLPGARQPW